MDHQPFIADEFEEIGCKDLSLLGFIGLVSGQIFNTNDPGHVTGDLDHDIRKFKLHREGIVENEDPGVPHGWPPGTERPSGMNAGDVFLMHPELIHLHDVETLKGFVEFLVGFGNGLNTLFQHVRPSLSVGPYHTATNRATARRFLTNTQAHDGLTAIYHRLYVL